MTSADGPAARLEAGRDAAVRQLAALEREFAGIVAASADANGDDEHDPEGATIAFERQHVAALLERARGRLGELDAALARLAAGIYGRCDRCGRPVEPGRLTARPTATTCLSCAAAARRR